MVFDNIQSHPRAREMVKQLVEDHRYDYIEVGSGISLRGNVKGIRIPSEEHHIRMHPMDFGEWLRVNGDTASENILRRFLDSREPLGQSVHRRMMERFGLYMAVGGMPQMVDGYLRTNNMMAVDARKREYLDRCRAGLTWTVMSPSTGGCSSGTWWPSNSQPGVMTSCSTNRTTGSVGPIP